MIKHGSGRKPTARGGGGVCNVYAFYESMTAKTRIDIRYCCTRAGTADTVNNDGRPLKRLIFGTFTGDRLIARWKFSSIARYPTTIDTTA